jgi:hypothetical protein
LENANQDEKNSYISEFFKSSTVEDLNEGQEFQLKLKTKDYPSAMWFMDITSSMKKQALETGFPITGLREGGIVEIPHFYYGGFVDINRL